MRERYEPNQTDDFAFYPGVVEHPVQDIELAEVDAVDVLLPYARGIGGGPFRTLRLSPIGQSLRMTDLSHLPGNHRETTLPRDVDMETAPFYELVLEPGTSTVFGRSPEHNPGQLPLLERSFVSREHFAIHVSLSGLAITVQSLRSHNGMGINALHTRADEYLDLYRAVS